MNSRSSNHLAPIETQTTPADRVCLRLRRIIHGKNISFRIIDNNTELMAVVVVEVLVVMVMVVVVVGTVTVVVMVVVVMVKNAIPPVV